MPHLIHDETLPGSTFSRHPKSTTSQHFHSAPSQHPIPPRSCNSSLAMSAKGVGASTSGTLILTPPPVLLTTTGKRTPLQPRKWTCPFSASNLPKSQPLPKQIKPWPGLRDPTQSVAWTSSSLLSLTHSAPTMLVSCCSPNTPGLLEPQCLYNSFPFPMDHFAFREIHGFATPPFPHGLNVTFPSIKRMKPPFLRTPALPT